MSGVVSIRDLSFEEYVDLFLQKVPKAERKDRLTFRGRCLMCGDSKKDVNKKRFYLLKGRGSYPSVVKCHNCGYKTSAMNFFNEIAPDEMDKRSKEWKDRDLSDIKKLTEGGLFKKNVIVDEVTPDMYLKWYDEELDRAKKTLENFIGNYTNPISFDPTAVAYMRGRMIPEYYINEMRLLKPEFYDFNTFRYAYFKDYIIIPFVDLEDNKPYYFHSRRYRKLDHTKMAPYLMCPYRPEQVEVKFFLNELRVHNGEPIIIAEGTLDSLNLPNSIAVNGIHKITDEQIAKFEHRYGKNIIYALDNEMIDNDAQLKAKELLRKGKKVFLWQLLAQDLPSAAQIKDFNKLCCVAGQYQFPMEAVVKYTRNNVSALL